MEKGKSKKGVKRTWCKKKLRQLFNSLTSTNNERVEATSKTLQFNKARVFSTVLLIIVKVQPALAVTPVLLVGTNATDAAAKAEKACTFFCQVALTAGKFVNTKEGRTALLWLACSGVSKSIQAASLLAAPSYGTAATALALFCTAAYGIQTIIGSETYVGLEFVNQAGVWCAKGFGILSATAILPKDSISVAIKLLEGVRSLS